MSNRELCAQLLNTVPDYKIGYVLAYLQGITADETEDDAFCEKMYQDYLNDPDPSKNETITLEKLASQEGITL